MKYCDTIFWLLVFIMMLQVGILLIGGLWLRAIDCRLAEIMEAVNGLIA